MTLQAHLHILFKLGNADILHCSILGHAAHCSVRYKIKVRFNIKVTNWGVIIILPIFIYKNPGFDPWGDYIDTYSLWFGNYFEQKQ